ncbi:kinase-like domain-containing protein [Aspergillus crustosus]
MDLFTTGALQERRLKTTYSDTGDRNHEVKDGSECWREVQIIGEGTFGSVWQECCISGPSVREVRAVKHVHKRQARILEMSRRELDALITFSDTSVLEYKQHFVQFLGWFDDPHNFYIAMEFIEHGDLQKHISQPFPEPEAASIVGQIAQALQYMHTKNFIHRDIKPLNILVSSPGPRWHVKVADFGISRKTDGSTPGTYNVGTVGYMAPELCGDSSVRYTPAIDVWSLGAVAFCLRTCNPPFRSIMSLVDYVRDPRQFPISLLGNSSGFCMNFVLGTMADVPERRLTIDHVLSHPWLSKHPTAPEYDAMSASASTSAAGSMSISGRWSNTYRDNDFHRTDCLSPATSTTESNAPRSNSKASSRDEDFKRRREPTKWTSSETARFDPPPRPDSEAFPINTAESMERAFKKKINEHPQMDWPVDAEAGGIEAVPVQLWSDIPEEYRFSKEAGSARNEINGGATEVLEVIRRSKGADPGAVFDRLNACNLTIEELNKLTAIAAEYHQQRRYKEFERLDEYLVSACNELLDDDTWVKIQVLDALAVTYHAQGMYEHSRGVYKFLYSIKKSKMGENHPDTQACKIGMYRALSLCKSKEIKNNPPNIQVTSTKPLVPYALPLLPSVLEGPRIEDICDCCGGP